MNGDTPMDARVSVLESDTRRIEEIVKEHNVRLQNIEVCLPSISQMKEDIKSILSEIRTMRDCRIAEDAVSKVQISWWETLWGQRAWDLLRAAGLVIITLLFAMNQHLMGAK